MPVWGYNMIRYLRLYGYFLRFAASRSMEFRVDFFFRIVMDLAYYAVGFAFFEILFQHSDSLAGWNVHQMRIFVASYILIDAIHMTVFSNNLWWLPVLVNKGDLDYYLIRPISSLFFLSLRDFAFNSFLNLFFANAILFWALHSYPEPLGFLHYIGFFWMILCGSLLYYGVHLVLILPVFWTQSGESLHGLFYNVARFMERPDRVYRGWVRPLLLVVLPFGLMASFPTRMLLEPFRLWVPMVMLGVLAAYFLGISWLWGSGLKSYSSASS